MFWSLLLEPGKRYTKVVDNPFHISAAVLDTSSQDDGIVSVVVDIGDTEALIANLSIQHGILQFPLDLQFDSGSRISFYTLGAKSNVHLSGYVTYDDEIFSEDEEESSDEEVATPVNAPGKRKLEESPSPGNKNGKVRKVAPTAPTTPNKNATLEGKASPTKPEKKTNAVTSKVEKPVDSDEDDDDEDWLDEEIEEEEDAEEEEEEEDEEEEVEEEEEDTDEEIDVSELQKIMDKQNKKNKQKKGKTLGNAVASKQDKQGLFPTKEPVPVFKTEKPPKGVKTPVTEGAKTPKSGMTSSNEGVKTPKDGNKKTPNKSPGTNTTPTLNGKTPKSETTVKGEGKSAKTPKSVKTGGVVCEDLVVGSGPEAKNGRMVSVYYEGRLVSNKKMFDKCDGGKGFKFRLGGGEVIKGWDIGVSGMKVGGKRKITCPPHMAYGKKGAPPTIPGNAALSFVVELKATS